MYDNAQRLVSTEDRKADNTIICGYEYTYDNLGRISTEKNLANGKTLCYTYDKLSRVIKCEEKNSSDQIVSTQNFAYDAAGNIISAPTGSFAYDENNKLTSYNNQTVEYDSDGNMISMPVEDIPSEYTDGIYDSSNRVLRAMHCSYTYDAENNRIRNDAGGYIYDYVYNTNCRLSQVLAMFEYGSSSFYIHGLGLIGEERGGQFYTYHYDYRGSTVAMTDQSGNIVGTAEYDIYGSQKNCSVPFLLVFGYNGRDGVQSDGNGFLYMRARYYCPNRRRFINADILDGNISDSTSLNRYAYVNGNPVSLVDPFGLSAERGGPTELEAAYMAKHIYTAKLFDESYGGWKLIEFLVDENGFRMGVYQKTIDGEIEYAIVNKGSTTISDWANNFLQVAGASPNMWESILEAKKFVSQYWYSNITFIGHSKGGAEAIANAVATNRNAIVFNPVTAFLDEYNLSVENYTGNILSYVVEGEMLDTLSTILGKNIGIEVLLESPYNYDIDIPQFDSEFIDTFMPAISVGQDFLDKAVDFGYSNYKKHGIELIIELLKKRKKQ